MSEPGISQWMTFTKLKGVGRCGEQLHRETHPGRRRQKAQPRSEGKISFQKSISLIDCLEPESVLFSYFLQVGLSQMFNVIGLCQNKSTCH